MGVGLTTAASVYLMSARARKLRVVFDPIGVPAGDIGSDSALRDPLGEGGTSGVAPERCTAAMPRLSLLSCARRKLEEPESHHSGLGIADGSKESRNIENGSVVMLTGNESDGWKVSRTN